MTIYPALGIQGEDQDRTVSEVDRDGDPGIPRPAGCCCGGSLR
jgi:hypothetical protein